MKLRKVEKIDLTKFEQFISVIEQVRDHHCEARAETMFYDLMIKLFRDVLSAVREGRPFITNTMSFPTEIYAALGVTGLEIDMATPFLDVFLDCESEIFEAAAGLGVRPEICSPQRAPIGWLAKGWYPRPTAVMHTSMDQCDNLSQTGNILGALYDVPVFCVNRPYRFWDQKGVDLMTGELQDAVAFLEEKTGYKMDWDKLEEAARLTLKMMEISVEISKLSLTARPCPVKAGTGFFIHWIRMAYAGRQEGVDYCQAFLDEMKEHVAQGKGYAPQEKYRLINLFTFPMGQHELIHWMEKEVGAVFVAEPMYHHYNEAELAKVDPSKPLEAIARYYYLEPYQQFYGPLAEFSDMIVNDAIDGGVDGAINFFNIKCRMGGAVARAIKDQLKEKAGIPTLTMGADMMDLSPAVGADLKKLLEQFFLILDTAKKKTAAA